MRPTVLLWDLAGRPERPGMEPGEVACAMCGRTVSSSAPIAKELGTNWTDPKAFPRPGSDRVCAACAWCCSGRGVGSLRAWSIVAAPGVDLAPSADRARAWLDAPGLHLTNRGQVRQVAATLADPPPGAWLVSVAVSGQKHLLPYARVNHGTGRWTARLETADVTATPEQWRRVLGHAAALRQAKHSATAVLDAYPDLSQIKDATDLSLWRAHAAPLAPYRRSPLLQLALWCLTKESTDDLADQYRP